ncbi:hypothetical protein DMENIID0001_058010 [Sergentomyia squamirostris]
MRYQMKSRKLLRLKRTEDCRHRARPILWPHPCRTDSHPMGNVECSTTFVHHQLRNDDAAASTVLDLTKKSFREESSKRELIIDEDEKTNSSSPASSISSSPMMLNKNKRKGCPVKLNLAKVTPSQDYGTSQDTMENHEDKYKKNTISSIIH